MYFFKIVNAETDELISTGSGFTDARKIFRILAHFCDKYPQASIHLFLRYEEV